MVSFFPSPSTFSRRSAMAPSSSSVVRVCVCALALLLLLLLPSVVVGQYPILDNIQAGLASINTAGCETRVGDFGPTSDIQTSSSNQGFSQGYPVGTAGMINTRQPHPTLPTPQQT